MKKISINDFAKIGLLGFVLYAATLVFIPTSTKAAATVTITSPTSGQGITGTEVTITGTATPESSIVLSNNGTSFAQTVADGSGSWSVHVTDLPAGDATITAKAITNTGSGYFVSSPDSDGPYSINQLRFSDNALNTLPGYPLTIDDPQLIILAAPASDLFYAVFPFVENSPPHKFIGGASPSQPSLVSGYPNMARAGVGSFSTDGTTYFSPNPSLSTLSVVDVATNAVTGSISTTYPAIVTTRSSVGDIYVIESDRAQHGKIDVIPAGATSIARSIKSPCADPSSVAGVGFSQDEAFPYYFVACVTEKEIKKVRVSDNIVVATWSVQYAPTGFVLSADNKKLYYFTSVFSTTQGANVINALDTTSGAVVKTLNLTNYSVGFFAGPDLRHIYIATPGNLIGGSDPLSNNIDVLDMLTDTISQITTPNPTAVVTASVGASASSAQQSVSFVLGVSAVNAGSLAKTGLVIALAVPFGVGIILAGLYTYYDYRRHRKPLEEAVKSPNYTYFHHLRVVSIPLLRYRISLSLSRRENEQSKHVRHI